jgi:hypothetical protein
MKRIKIGGLIDGAYVVIRAIIDAVALTPEGRVERMRRRQARKDRRAEDRRAKRR